MVAQTRFAISGMDCGACARKIDTVVRRLPGVKDVNVSVTSNAMTVVHENDADVAGTIPSKLKSLGYGATLALAAGVQPASRGNHIDRNHSPDHDSCDDHCHDHHHNNDHNHRHNHDHDNDHCHDHENHDHEHDHGHHHDREGHHDHEHDHEDHSHVHKHGRAQESAAGAVAPPDVPWWTSAKAKLTIVVASATGVAWLFSLLLPAYGKWAFVAAVLVGLIPIAKRAAMAALNGVAFTIESLMTVAAIGAVFIGATEEAAAVVLLFLVGEMLEGAAAGQARRSIKALTALVPDTALARDHDTFREVPATSLAVGAVIMVPPGERIAADGVIIAGQGHVDEASVTGESLPVFKPEGALVFAGTVNSEATLQVRVTAGAADNTIARVVRLVEEAQESKAPTERFIDRFAHYYTPAVFLAGVLVATVPPLLFAASWVGWIYKGLAVLLIGCPCALVISTPAAIAAALSAGARRGLLIKGGATLEGLARITVAAVDKTGTLTRGKPVITDIIAIQGAENDVLSMAASLEIGSTHPLAAAILDRAKAEALKVAAAEHVVAVGGKGVQGQSGGRALFLGSVAATQERTPIDLTLLRHIENLHGDGKSLSVLVADGKVAGLIAIRDEARPDVKDGIAALRAMGVSVVMLTGDHRRTADAIGRDLGIAVRAELLPAQKLQVIRELQKAGQKVVKVGDGINDAPALAAADIGVAMGGGTDVALETADAAILHGRVSDVASIIRLGRVTMANIRQNITIALGLKLIFLLTTIAGLTGLWPAILADTGATVLVTANALRLLRQK